MATTIDYKFTYATKDELGNALTNIVGMAIYYLPPGGTWTRAGQVDYPTLSFSFEVEDDGQYAICHRTIVAAVTHPELGVTKVIEGKPSTGVPVRVQCSAADSSGEGTIIVAAVPQSDSTWETE